MTRLNNTIEKSMFYGAKPDIFEKARLLRFNMTKEEKVLWSILRNNKMLGLRFKRQHPIYRFIADFYCHKIKLVIEADGKTHLKDENKEYDTNRNCEMEKFGITVLRFENEEINDKLENIKLCIENKCKELLMANAHPSLTE
ncbi:MAG: endonuclease domain-containing protein [Bacteroidales bacterium]|nr:endonuclease domain-containing protein [Bacteroidales bacterium]